MSQLNVWTIGLYLAGLLILAVAAHRDGDFKGPVLMYERHPLRSNSGFWSKVFLYPFILAGTTSSIPTLGLWSFLPFAVCVGAALLWYWIEYGRYMVPAPNWILNADRRITFAGWVRMLHAPLFYSFPLAFYISQYFQRWNVVDVLVISLLLLMHLIFSTAQKQEERPLPLCSARAAD